MLAYVKYGKAPPDASLRPFHTASTQTTQVNLDRTAIDWVLLSTTTTPGPDGDRLVDTTFIQRIHTAGGLTPPAADCNAATADKVVEAPYTADYVFWKKTAA